MYRRRKIDASKTGERTKCCRGDWPTRNSSEFHNEILMGNLFWFWSKINSTTWNSIQRIDLQGINRFFLDDQFWKPRTSCMTILKNYNPTETNNKVYILFEVGFMIVVLGIEQSAYGISAAALVGTWTPFNRPCTKQSAHLHIKHQTLYDNAQCKQDLSELSVCFVSQCRRRPPDIKDPISGCRTW